MAIDTTSPRSRRAILLGTLGGAVAAAASAAVGRLSPVSATDGDIVHVGGTYSATARTKIAATGVVALWGDSDTNIGIHGSSDGGNGVEGSSVSGLGVGGVSTSSSGVYGYSNSSYGVHGSSRSSVGVYGSGHSSNGVQGYSDSSVGVYGNSNANDQPAILGQSFGSSTGVQGFSGNADDQLPSAPPRTGVFGSSPRGAGLLGTSGTGSGVVGISGGSATGPTNTGVYGEAAHGRGGQFSGGKAQLRLVPSAPGRTGHPVAGLAGDLFVDGLMRLWFCKGGTNWVKIV